ncbi:MAG: MFS transporter, partial [Desulfobacterales bacterium]
MYYGWYIVCACGLISCYLSGTVFLGFTALIEPITREFGWSYTQISLAASLRGLEQGLFVPVAGILIDRWGPGRMIFGGSFLAGLGLIMLSRINSLAMFYGAIFVVAIGGSAMTSNLLMTVVATWFRKKAGLVMGIASSGVALGGLIIPLLTLIIDSYGWRSAAMCMGAGMWCIPLPLSWVFKKRPLSSDSKAYFVMPLNQAGFETGDSSDGTGSVIPLKSVWFSWPFWMISLAFLFHIFAVSAVSTHVMPFFSSVGIDRTLASIIASVVPLMTIFGRIGFGWIGDMLNKRSVTAFVFFLTALGVLLLTMISSERTWLIAVSVSIYGLGWGGAVPMLSNLLKHYFGVKNLATIMGFSGSVTM